MDLRFTKDIAPGYMQDSASLSLVMRKPVHAIYAKNKGVYQPANLRSRVSAFVFRCYLYLLNPKFQLSRPVRVSPRRSPEDRFSRAVAHSEQSLFSETAAKMTDDECHILQRSD